MKYNINIFLIVLIFLLGCKKDKRFSIENYKNFKTVFFDDFINKKIELTNREIVIEAYVLGSELYENSNNGRIWIMVLGDKPQLNDARANQLVFPKINNKIRVGEDGYNKEIIDRCYDVCNSIRKRGHLVKVYGIYEPSKPFNHFTRGVDMQLAAIEYNGTIINTDYNDHSNFKEKTPSVMKKIYKGGKSITNFIKKGI